MKNLSRYEWVGMAAGAVMVAVALGTLCGHEPGRRDGPPPQAPFASPQEGGTPEPTAATLCRPDAGPAQAAQAVHQKLLHMVAYDPDGAAHIFQALPADVQTGCVDSRALLADVLAEQAPWKAVEFAETLPEDLRIARMLTIAGVLVRTQPQELEAYYFALPPDDPLRSALAPTIAGIVAVTNQDRAFRLLALAGPTGTSTPEGRWTLHPKSVPRDYEEAFAILMETWIVVDPVSAMRFIHQHPENFEARTEIVVRSVEQRAWEDPLSTSLWAAHLPARLREPALLAAITVWSERDTDSAVAFADVLLSEFSGDGAVVRRLMARCETLRGYATGSNRQFALP